MIDISVCIPSYNNEEYIRQTLDSVLMQKTHYTYEIVVSDDCSKDKTKEILLEYKDKYPNIVRPFFSDCNKGIPENLYRGRCNCRGKYIVSLDGDDYYINENKLEIQGKFLDEHPEYDAVGTRVECRLNENDFGFSTIPKLKYCNKEFGINEYNSGLYLNHHGLMFRNFFLNDESKEYFGSARKISSIIDDMVDEVLLINKYKIYFLDVVTDAYRVINHENAKNFNNIYSLLDQTKFSIETYNKLNKLYGNKISFYCRYRDKVSDIILMSLLTRKFKEFIEVYNEIPKEYRGLKIILGSIPKCLRTIFSNLIRKIKK